MADKLNLDKARWAQNNEFYTDYDDICAELDLYDLQGRVVFLPCDDPEWSAFAKYFVDKFEYHKLRGLICSCYYETQADLFEPFEFKRGYWCEYDGKVWSAKNYYERGNGDFRAYEVQKLRARADVIITNPPFSLFREFFDWCLGKDYVLIGSAHAVKYMTVFPEIQQCRCRYYKPKRLLFTTDKGAKCKINAGWYSNISPRPYPPFLKLTYDLNPAMHKRYANFDAVDCESYKHVPRRYYGIVGVPGTFFDHWNPAQFELLGIPSGHRGTALGVSQNPRTGKHDLFFRNADGSITDIFTRVLIRRKQILCRLDTHENVV